MTAMPRLMYKSNKIMMWKFLRGEATVIPGATFIPESRVRKVWVPKILDCGDFRPISILGTLSCRGKGDQRLSFMNSWNLLLNFNFSWIATNLTHWSTYLWLIFNTWPEPYFFIQTGLNILWSSSLKSPLNINHSNHQNQALSSLGNRMEAADLIERCSSGSHRLVLHV